MQKSSYPQDPLIGTSNPPYDVKQWITSMREIYADIANTNSFEESFKKITKGWDDMDKLNFKNWMRFYQENAHEKYKIAQSHGYLSNGPGSYIPLNAIKAKLPMSAPAPKQPSMENYTANQDANAAEDEARIRADVKKKIQSLISRLNSAEKLATHPDVQVELKKVLELGISEWVTRLQALKRDVQLVPMRRASSPILEDIIVKNANQLIVEGHKKAAAHLLKIADMAMAPQPANPTNPIDAHLLTNPVAGGLGQDFAYADDNEFEEEVNEELNEELDEDFDPFAEITVTAQAVPENLTSSPAAPPAAPAPQAVSPEAPAPSDVALNEQPVIEVEEEPVDVEDDPFASVLADVKISDIISRLEAVANMFKNREIARQLTIIDLMMDAAGIAPFFPSMAEATRSALESNQYCQTRIEDILAKLRGTVQVPIANKIDLGGQEDTAEDFVKEKLEQADALDRAKKEKKQMETMQADQEAFAPAQTPPAAPAPGVTQAPDQLKQPVQIPQAPKAVP